MSTSRRLTRRAATSCPRADLEDAMFANLRVRDLGPVLREAWSGFQRHQAPRLGAALAFYTMLSLSPLLLVVLAIVGAIFGPDAARGEITGQIEGLVGQE